MDLIYSASLRVFYRKNAVFGFFVSYPLEHFLKSFTKYRLYGRTKKFNSCNLTKGSPFSLQCYSILQISHLIYQFTDSPIYQLGRNRVYPPRYYSGSINRTSELLTHSPSSRNTRYAIRYYFSIQGIMLRSFFRTFSIRKLASLLRIALK